MPRYHLGLSNSNIYIENILFRDYFLLHPELAFYINQNALKIVVKLFVLLMPKEEGLDGNKVIKSNRGGRE
jgi:hypothetical protein